jgi:uncharacterized protein
MLKQEICQSCGACCAAFRVSFYWSEADPSAGGNVPFELTDSLPPYRRCMKMVSTASRRCIALDGEVGSQVHCRIYANRSSTCREFGFDPADDDSPIHPEKLARCNQARARWGVPPIR